MTRTRLIVLRLLLGAVFCYAGLVKLGNPSAFEADVASFRLLPLAWVPAFAASLPFFEAVAGFWLILGWRFRPPALGLALLALVFLAALGLAALRGTNVSCGCFGAHAGTSGNLGWPVARDLLLLIASVQVCRSGLTAAAE